MSKKGTKQDQAKGREDKLRRQLAQAQSDLQQAQEKRMQVMKMGERDVDKARQTAAQRLAKATQRMEKRTRVVSDLESKILAARPSGTPSLYRPASPLAAANELQGIEASNQPAAGGAVSSETTES